MNKMPIFFALVGIIILFGCIQQTGGALSDKAQDKLPNLQIEKDVLPEPETEPQILNEDNFEELEPIEEEKNETKVVQTESMAVPDSMTQDKPKTQIIVKEFDVVAKKFSFEPSTITVKKGDTVRLRITSTDTSHGFLLNKFGIDEIISPGAVKTVEFVATESGTYFFSCSVYCGSGHSEMTGQLIVQD